MSFSDKLRSLKIVELRPMEVDYHLIKCQYNPDRWRHWKKVCGNTLSIKKSPHYAFLNGNHDKYIKMHELYGRNKVWITNKCLKFQSLLEDIEKNGIKDIPTVLKQPVIENPLNKGLEIFEGHHRIAIMQFLGLKPKVVICESVLVTLIV